MFKNKHVITAFIVTPILAVLGYFAVDAVVSETPHAAKAGSSYELVELPNCRYSSGICGLKNGEFKINLSTEWLDDTRMELNLKSIAPLEGAKVALIDPSSQELPPQDMMRTDEDGMAWSLPLSLDRFDHDKSRLRVVVSSGDVMYYADASMKFTVYEAIFEKDFRK